MLSRQEPFAYNFKTAAASDVAAIGYGTGGNQLGLELVLPTAFYSCDGLLMHLQFVHDGTQPGRNITAIAVQSDSTTAPAFKKSLPFAVTPTGLTLDFSTSLSGIMNPTGRNVVVVTFDAAISGTIKLFKLDMTYQVVGVRQ